MPNRDYHDVALGGRLKTRQCGGSEYGLCTVQISTYGGKKRCCCCDDLHRRWINNNRRKKKRATA